MSRYKYPLERTIGSGQQKIHTQGFKLKHLLYQAHIKHCTHPNTKQIIPLPTTTEAISSAAPCGFAKKSTFRKQYTINIPITAGGSTLPRYSTLDGISFPFGKTKNGIARVKKVTIATTAIIDNDLPALTGIFIPSFLIFFLNILPARNQAEHNTNH